MIPPEFRYMASTPVADFRKGAMGLMALVRTAALIRSMVRSTYFMSEKSGPDQGGLVRRHRCVCLPRHSRKRILLAPDWANHGAAEPRAVACAGRWAGLEEDPTDGCEAAAIAGLKICGILNQAFGKIGQPVANML